MSNSSGSMLLLLFVQLGFHPKQATVHHLDEGTRSEVDISQDILNDVEVEISETVNKIMSRKFSKYPSPKKCSACDWSFFCTKKKRSKVKFIVSAHKVIKIIKWLFKLDP